MRKLSTLLTAGALSLALAAPTVSAETDSPDYENWNKDRYSDKIDIDGALQKKSEQEGFEQQAIETIKENAENVNFNEEEGSEEGSGDSHFTYDGGTKQFLDRDLGFKEYTLRSVGDHAEVWVANDLSFPEGDPRSAHTITQEQVDKLTEEFDSNIYPKATDFFGKQDPLDGTNAVLEDLGVVPEGYYATEDDEKITILVNNIKDDNYNDPEYPFFVAGYFWQTVEMYTDRNIINIDSRDWDERLEETFFSTTIHELQHLIHADYDSDETSWLNEGMSTFSEYLGGYGVSTGSVNFFLDHPENSLTAWDEHVNAETGPETIADYGLVQLFTLYNYEQFGQELIRSVATSGVNSIESFEQAYEEFGINKTFEEVYQDFTSALVMDDNKFKGGKYGFENVDLRELPTEDGVRGETVNFESAKDFEKEGVPAWGTDFKEFNFEPGDNVKSFDFNGVDFLPFQWKSTEDPLNEGNNVFYSTKGDEMDNAMIFEADLTGLSEATLSFDHYLQIEEGWDFGMVQISTDGGETWTSLSNENTTSDVVEQGYPKIKENVPGFTGMTDSFRNETFDLSEYAGEEVLVSFRYLTDWGHMEEGWYLDNIEIPEAGISYTGDSTEDFTSQAELDEEYVNYGVSFFKEKNNGKYQVVHVDPFNITDEDALELQQVFRPGKTYMTTHYAAPQDSTEYVDFEYEVSYKENGKKK
ncbi:immune inhibitor A domain-containing protein [Salimicrobium halophilum]|uniref:Immune inhibitor A peptidase M6 n=1 Tax=Salimicrobium halophilum TaxID=86666 RepID=A0A1G8W9A9_9BACI|nr:immune inhibitor A domain-containing protein [Salimicrobium halophilum]SDJ74716.1 Immune inhibitor A peptidase M6 [Salimicrobium halophilum]